MSGAVPLGFQWYPNVTAPIQGKGALALAVAGDQRLTALPDVPTAEEAGLPTYKVAGWFGLAAPSHTPRPILEKLNKGVADALDDPAVRQGFDQAGAQPMALPLEQSRKFLSDEIVKYRDIITKAGVPRIQ